MTHRLASIGFARPRQPGFTLVEAAISMVLVSGLLVAALNTVGAAKLGQQNTAERGRAYLLAQELMSEIMRQDYADPEDVGPIDLRDPALTTSVMGLDSGESASNRSTFDDVDDYYNWNRQPQNKDGSVIPYLIGWKRIVEVERRSLADPTQPTATEEGLKHITVQVTRDDTVIAQLEAIKGAGLPLLPTGPRVLFVVVDATALTAQELARQTLMESWGCSVSLIAATAPQADFDADVGSADVAYVSLEITGTDLGSKLVDTSIGVVNENPDLIGVFGFGSEALFKSRNEIDIIDNAHYITSPFGTGLLTFLSSLQGVDMITSGEAPGLNTLGTLFNVGSGWKSALASIDVSGELFGGGTAAGRRVQLPWGQTGFDFNALNVDGQTIMKRSIEWAAGMEQS